MSLGENVKKRRLELGLTQQELADALGYKTRSSIAKIEQDSTHIPDNKLSSLSNILHCTITYLLEGGHTEDTENLSQQLLGHSIVGKIGDFDRSDRRKCVAVILAGGDLRVNQYQVPYQFVTVKDKPVILYTMETFQRHPLIEDIYVVCLQGWEDFLPAYANQYSITKLRSIIPAGKTGIESIKNAVEWLSPTYRATDLLIIQEATRPFVEPETISNAIKCCKQHGSAVVFERMDRMTPFMIDEKDNTLTHLSAYQLINVESPEVYALGFLRNAFFEAASIGHKFTETICAVFLHHLGKTLKFCEGAHNNLRIVYQEDLKILEALV